MAPHPRPSAPPSGHRQPGTRWTGALAAALLALGTACPGPPPAEPSAPAVPTEPITTTLPPLPQLEGRPEPQLRAHVLPTGPSDPSGLQPCVVAIEHSTYGLVLYWPPWTGGPEARPDAAALEGLLSRAGLQPAQVRTEVLASPSWLARGFVRAGAASSILVAGPESSWSKRSRELPEGAWVVPFADNPPFGPFPHYLDLAGDGRIAVVSLPGPHPGHLGLVLRGAGNPVLLAGGIVPSAEELEADSAQTPSSASDPGAFRRSLSGIQALATASPPSAVITGMEVRVVGEAPEGLVTLHPDGGTP